MKKIYKILAIKNPKQILAIGQLESENESSYVLKTDGKIEKYLKSEVMLEDIFEKGTDEYELDIVNENSESFKLKLSRHCFGGCG